MSIVASELMLNDNAFTPRAGKTYVLKKVITF